MPRKLLIISLVFLLSLTQNLQAQHSIPDTVAAEFITTKIDLDGKLEEPEWQTAPHIKNFTQRELDFGEPSI
jgi:hypothetical protein